MSFFPIALAAAQLGSNLIGGNKAKHTAERFHTHGVLAWEDYANQLDALYRQAFGALEGAGKSAKADILQNQTGLMAGTAQSMASRGLYNTTALDQFNRGIAHSTNRSLAQLNEDLGLLKSNLFTGLASQKAQAAAGLSGAWMNAQPTYTPTSLFGPLQQLQSFQNAGGLQSLFGGGGSPEWHPPMA